MRFVEPKSEAQLDLQSLHRARDRLVGERTALINQIRVLLLERGMVVPQGRRRLQLELAALVADETLGWSSRIRSLLVDMQAAWEAIDRRIAAFDDEFAALARSDEPTRRRATIRGIGPLIASALVAAVGEGRKELCARPRLGGLARAGSQAGDHRRPAQALGDQPPRQQVPPQDAGARRPSGPAGLGQERHGARPLARRAAGTGTSEHGGGGAGQQAGLDRLGGAGTKADVHRRAGARGRLSGDEFGRGGFRPARSAGGGRGMA